jgi:predicted TIM-barrel fold metal-dependent hydrolase
MNIYELKFLQIIPFEKKQTHIFLELFDDHPKTRFVHYHFSYEKKPYGFCWRLRILDLVNAEDQVSAEACKMVTIGSFYQEKCGKPTMWGPPVMFVG